MTLMVAMALWAANTAALATSNVFIEASQTGASASQTLAMTSWKP